MKHLIVATGLALGLATAAFAQPAGDPARAEMRAEKHAAFLAEKLNLTEAQKLQVQSIFQTQAAARRELHEQTQAQLAEVLTPEQQAQLEQLHADRKARWQEHRRERHGMNDE